MEYFYTVKTTLVTASKEQVLYIHRIEEVLVLHLYQSVSSKETVRGGRVAEMSAHSIQRQVVQSQY